MYIFMIVLYILFKNLYRVGLNYVLSLVIFRKSNNINIVYFNFDKYNLYMERKDIFCWN